MGARRDSCGPREGLTNKRKGAQRCSKLTKTRRREAVRCAVSREGPRVGIGSRSDVPVLGDVRMLRPHRERAASAGKHSLPRIGDESVPMRRIDDVSVRRAVAEVQVESERGEFRLALLVGG